MVDSYSLNKDAKALEDAFFAEQNAKLLAELRDKAERAERREVLKQALEIDDEALLDRLEELEISVETVVAFGLVPLVEVAWADGEIHPRERQAILDALVDSGAEPGGLAFQLMESWLATRPGPEVGEAWMQYTAALCEALDPERREALKRSVMAHTRTVAEAAGGFLGLGSKISAAEQKVLEAMEWSFGE